MNSAVPIYGFGGGGGTALNFSVVGNPQPTTAKENTIWIDTDVKISSWIFIATEPTNPTDGMVWISTGASSTVEFNALKKNGIQVYPMSAKQYVSGAWVDKEAKSYQNGAWVDWWNGELYKNGDAYTHVTGGWSNFTTDYGSLTFSNEYMQWLQNTSSHYGEFGTNLSVDISRFTTLHIDIKANNATRLYIYIGTTKGYVEPDDIPNYVSLTRGVRETKTFDLSAYSNFGNVYFKFKMGENSTFQFYSIHLE